MGGRVISRFNTYKSLNLSIYHIHIYSSLFFISRGYRGGWDDKALKLDVARPPMISPLISNLSLSLMLKFASSALIRSFFEHLAAR